MIDTRITTLRKNVWKYYRVHGRHNLPWRKTKDPYKILVSEVMLQQTQVSRVIEKYKEFLTAFPNVHTLAKAPLADVLKMWSGLGYNRRAKYLRDAAKILVLSSSYRTEIAREELLALPGVGDYTAKAVRVFAYNEPEILIETNIRTVFIQYLYPDILDMKCGCKLSNCSDCVPIQKIRDVDLLPFIEAAAVGQEAREWHWALMDYGAYLKKTHPNPSRKSMHYTKQSKFEGSLRQVRGAILRELHTEKPALTKLPFGKE